MTWNKGVEELSVAARVMYCMRESVLEGFTAEQVLSVWRSWVDSEGGKPPEEWESWQVEHAARGVVPRWTEEGVPICDKGEILECLDREVVEAARDLVSIRAVGQYLLPDEVIEEIFALRQRATDRLVAAARELASARASRLAVAGGG